MPDVPTPHGVINPVEGYRDAVAFTRAFASGDVDGAYTIYKGRTLAEQMLLPMSLAVILHHVVGDDDVVWGALLNDLEEDAR